MGWKKENKNKVNLIAAALEPWCDKTWQLPDFELVK
jgi:hypothetical protein